MLLNVFVCNVLLQNAYKNQQTYVRKTYEHGPKMLPKPLQNRSWRGSGGHLGATLETRCFQDLIFDDFGSILGPPLGAVWGHFGHQFFDVFLKWLFDGLGLHLASQNESQKGAKDTSYQKVKIELSLQPELDPEGCEGAENRHFFDVFLEPHFEMVFGTHFGDFGSLLGSLLETILVILGYHFCINF